MKIRPHLHFLFLCTAALPLVPLLVHLHLPLVWPWRLIVGFSLDVLKKSILAAALVWVFLNRNECTKIVRRLCQHRWHTVLFLLYCGVLLWSSGVHGYLLADSFVVFQFVQHKWEQRASVVPEVLATSVAGLYLLTAIFLAFTYNDVVVSVRFYGAFDDVLRRLDLGLFGTTSSTLAHQAAMLLPYQAFELLEAIYYSMFWVLGATVTLCALNFGLKRALQFAGAILVAQFLAVMLFYFWPSHGPYYSCPDHFARLRWMLPAYQLQYQMLQDAQLMWAHARMTRLPFDYYLSFPCTHIAQPLIAVWFLRPWKSLMVPLGIYCVVLSVAVVLLEWHYLVDLAGGVAIAVASVWSIGDLRWNAAAASGCATAKAAEQPAIPRVAA